MQLLSMVLLLSLINIQTETLQFEILRSARNNVSGIKFKKKNQMERSWNMTEVVFVGAHPPIESRCLWTLAK